MSYTAENTAEIDLLLLFDLSTSQVGIKIHADAEPSAIAAAHRLFKKGLIDQDDGGYLTNRGLVAAEHAQALLALLNLSVSE